MHHTSAQLTAHAASLSSDIKDWGTLAATLLLVGVTAWYVALTKRIADAANTSADSSEAAAKASKETAEASREAAEASKTSAVAARRAADAAVADLSVNFALAPSTEGHAPQRLGVIVTGTGAAVFIHGARLSNAMRRREWPHRSEQVSLGLNDIELERQRDLPVLVHAGESVRFLVPDHLTRGKFSEYRRVPMFTKVARAVLAFARVDNGVMGTLEELRNPTIPFLLHDLSLSVVVYYSLDKDSPAVPRQVSTERVFPIL